MARWRGGCARRAGMYGGYNVVVEIRTTTSRDLHLAPPTQPASQPANQPPPNRSTRAIHDDVETAPLLSLTGGDAAGYAAKKR